MNIFFNTDNNVKELILINKEAFELAENFGMKSDILRLELLYKFGGINVDTDFLCIKPFDDFHYKYDFYLGTRDDKSILTGLIGSKPKNPMILKIIQSIDVEGIRQKKNIFKITGPALATNVLINFLDNSNNLLDQKTCIFPRKYFYPVNQLVKEKLFELYRKRYLCCSFLGVKLVYAIAESSRKQRIIKKKL